MSIHKDIKVKLETGEESEMPIHDVIKVKQEPLEDNEMSNLEEIKIKLESFEESEVQPISIIEVEETNVKKELIDFIEEPLVNSITLDTKSKANLEIKFKELSTTQSRVKHSLQRNGLVPQTKSASQHQNDRRDLVEQQKTLQLVPKSPQHHCVHCGSGFIRKSNLTIHLRREICTKKHQTCSTCHKVFTSQESLDTHMLAHTNCDICGQKFGDNNALQMHKKDQHTKLQHQCLHPDCKKVMQTTMPSKRALWSENDLFLAIRAVERGTLSTYKAAERYKVPRRTIRNHLHTGSLKKALGRKPLLSAEQETNLVSRIIRFAEVGMPLTPRILKRLVYKYCELNNIKHCFNQNAKVAGKDWFTAFIRKNPEISKIKAQFMNPARALKLNKFIVDDHFKRLDEVYDKLDLKNSMMEESTNPEESSNAITIQVDVHHRHYSQLSASIATTSHDCVNEPETTSDLPSIHRDYPKTAAQRMAEYRARKKKETPIVNHRKHKKSDAERAKEYRARKKAKIQSADSIMEESTNPEESSNAITVQVDVHHHHCSQLSASIATTSHDCVNEPETTSDLSSIHRDYPKTAAQRMAEYRARKKKQTPIVNHRKHKKSDAERAQEYRTRNKAQIQEHTSQSQNFVESTAIQQSEHETNHLAYTDFHRHHLAHDEFQKKFVRNSFGYVCSVCERLWFKDDLRSASLQHDAILKTIVPHLDIKDVALCNTCVASLNNNSIPVMASYNGFKFPKKPDYY